MKKKRNLKIGFTAIIAVIVTGTLRHGCRCKNALAEVLPKAILPCLILAGMLILGTACSNPAGGGGGSSETLTGHVNIGSTAYETIADIQAAITASLGEFTTVNVTGTRESTGPLSLIIPEGRTVNWTATLTGSGEKINLPNTFLGTLNITGGAIQTTSSNQNAITINGAGTVNISGNNTLITSSNNLGGAIVMQTNARRLNMSGGTVRNTAASGTQLFAAISAWPAMNPEIVISGGTVDGNLGVAIVVNGNTNSSIIISGNETIITSANTNADRGTIMLDHLTNGTLTINSGIVQNTGTNGHAITVNAANDDTRRSRVTHTGGEVDPMPDWLEQ